MFSLTLARLDAVRDKIAGQWWQGTDSAALGRTNRFGVSPLFSGLVIVGSGMGMPEMVVSIAAALGGQADIAPGNLVGGNLANIPLFSDIAPS